MRKTILTVLALCLLISVLAGCGSKPSEKADYDLEALSAKLVESSAFSDILSPVNPDIAAAFYGFDAGDVDSMSIYCSTGATTEEIGLFKCVDDAAAARVLEKAEARVVSQKTAYESYAPEEVPKLEDAIVKADGVFVFYIVANNYSEVNSIIK